MTSETNPVPARELGGSVQSAGEFADLYNRSAAEGIQNKEKTSVRRLRRVDIWGTGSLCNSRNGSLRGIARPKPNGIGAQLNSARTIRATCARSPRARCRPLRSPRQRGAASEDAARPITGPSSCTGCSSARSALPLSAGCASRRKRRTAPGSTCSMRCCRAPMCGRRISRRRWCWSRWRSPMRLS